MKSIFYTLLSIFISSHLFAQGGGVGGGLGGSVSGTDIEYLQGYHHIDGEGNCIDVTAKTSDGESCGFFDINDNEYEVEELVFGTCADLDICKKLESLSENGDSLLLCLDSLKSIGQASQLYQDSILQCLKVYKEKYDSTLLCLDSIKLRLLDTLIVQFPEGYEVEVNFEPLFDFLENDTLFVQDTSSLNKLCELVDSLGILTETVNSIVENGDTSNIYADSILQCQKDQKALLDSILEVSAQPIKRQCYEQLIEGVPVEYCVIHYSNGLSINYDGFGNVIAIIPEEAIQVNCNKFQIDFSNWPDTLTSIFKGTVNSSDSLLRASVDSVRSKLNDTIIVRITTEEDDTIRTIRTTGYNTDTTKFEVSERTVCWKPARIRYNNDTRGCGESTSNWLVAAGCGPANYEMWMLDYNGQQVIMNDMFSVTSSGGAGWNQNFTLTLPELDNTAPISVTWDWFNAGAPCYRLWQSIGDQDIIDGYGLMTVEIDRCGKKRFVQMEPEKVPYPLVELTISNCYDSCGVFTSTYIGKDGEVVTDVLQYVADNTGLTVAELSTHFNSTNIIKQFKDCNYQYSDLSEPSFSCELVVLEMCDDTDNDGNADVQFIREVNICISTDTGEEVSRDVADYEVTGYGDPDTQVDYEASENVWRCSSLLEFCEDVCYVCADFGGIVKGDSKEKVKGVAVKGECNRGDVIEAEFCTIGATTTITKWLLNGQLAEIDSAGFERFECGADLCLPDMNVKITDTVVVTGITPLSIIKCYGADATSESQHINTDNSTDASFSIGGTGGTSMKWEWDLANPDGVDDFTNDIVACIDGGQPAMITIEDVSGNIVSFEATSYTVVDTDFLLFSGFGMVSIAGKVLEAYLICGDGSQSGEAYFCSSCGDGGQWFDTVTGQVIPSESLSDCKECETEIIEGVACLSEDVAGAGLADDPVLFFIERECNVVVSTNYITPTGVQVDPSFVTLDCAGDFDIEKIFECVVDEDGNRWIRYVFFEDGEASNEFFVNESDLMNIVFSLENYTQCPNESGLIEVEKVCGVYEGEQTTGYLLAYTDGEIQYSLSASSDDSVVGFREFCCDDCILSAGCIDPRITRAVSATLCDGTVIPVEDLVIDGVPNSTQDILATVAFYYGGGYDVRIELQGSLICTGTNSHSLDIWNTSACIESYKLIIGGTASDYPVSKFGNCFLDVTECVQFSDCEPICLEAIQAEVAIKPTPVKGVKGQIRTLGEFSRELELAKSKELATETVSATDPPVQACIRHLTNCDGEIIESLIFVNGGILSSVDTLSGFEITQCPLPQESLCKWEPFSVTYLCAAEGGYYKEIILQCDIDEDQRKVFFEDDMGVAIEDTTGLMLSLCVTVETESCFINDEENDFGLCDIVVITDVTGQIATTDTTLNGLPYSGTTIDLTDWETCGTYSCPRDTSNTIQITTISGADTLFRKCVEECYFATDNGTGFTDGDKIVFYTWYNSGGETISHTTVTNSNTGTEIYNSLANTGTMPSFGDLEPCEGSVSEPTEVNGQNQYFVTTTTGIIAAGFYSYSICNCGNAVGSVNDGVNGVQPLKPGLCFEFDGYYNPVTDEFVVNTPMSYNATGTEFSITIKE